MIYLDSFKKGYIEYSYYYLLYSYLSCYTECIYYRIVITLIQDNHIFIYTRIIIINQTLTFTIEPNPKNDSL